MWPGCMSYCSYFREIFKIHLLMNMTRTGTLHQPPHKKKIFAFFFFGGGGGHGGEKENSWRGVY